MKVTLRNSYNWQSVVLDPTEAKGYNEEFVFDLQYKDVLEILRIQVEMEQLQQRLKPMYEAAEKLAKANAEAKAAAEKAELERLEAEGENLPV